MAPDNDFSAELAERYGYINRALPADELTPFVERLAHRITSFPAHTVAHVKAAVDLGTFGSLAEGLLVEARESDLSVASEVTQARVAEALKVGAETYEGELELEFLSNSPRSDNPATEDRPHAHKMRRRSLSKPHRVCRRL